MHGPPDCTESHCLGGALKDEREQMEDRLELTMAETDSGSTDLDAANRLSLPKAVTRECPAQLRDSSEEYNRKGLRAGSPILTLSPSVSPHGSLQTTPSASPRRERLLQGSPQASPRKDLQKLEDAVRLLKDKLKDPSLEEEMRSKLEELLEQACPRGLMAQRARVACTCTHTPRAHVAPVRTRRAHATRLSHGQHPPRLSRPRVPRMHHTHAGGAAADARGDHAFGLQDTDEARLDSSRSRQGLVFLKI